MNMDQSGKVAVAVGVAGSRLLADVLADRVRDCPDEVALIVDGGSRLTFRRWEERSNAFARGLCDVGLAPHSLVALRFDNTRLDEYAIAYLGAHKAGFGVVPVSTQSPEREVDRTLRAANVAAVVSGGEPAGDRVGVLSLRFADLSGSDDVTPFRVPVRPEDVAEVIYTSGASGERRAVAATHANVAVGLDEEDTDDAAPAGYFLHAMPFGTNAGQVTLRGALNWPPTTLVLPEFDENRFGELIEQYRVTSVLLVPAMALWLIRARAGERFDLSSVRDVVLTAAAMPASQMPRLAEIFPAAGLHNGYASTESWPARTTMRYDPARPQALGRPLSGGAIRITAPDGSPLPPGAVGQIWLRSAAGVPPRSYLGDPDAGRDVFDGDWVRTGDLGRQDGDGYLFLVGRRSELVDVGGFEVSELEVEEVLHEHPDVAEAAVVGLPDDVLGQLLAAAVVTTGPVTPTALRAFAAQRLPRHKVPTRIALLPALPRNEALKVRKDEVRELLRRSAADAGSDVAADSGAVALGTELETALTRIWAGALGVGRIGVTDDFFDLGGTSLSAMDVVLAMAVETGVRLSLRELFDRPTIAGAATSIQEKLAHRDDPGTGDGPRASPAPPAIRRLPRVT